MKLDMSDDIRMLLPQHKTDVKNARAIAERGYPAVERIIPDLLEWLQDGNWPVAQELAPFLASIGAPLIPEIRKILLTNDEDWKNLILIWIVAKSPEIAEGLREELTRMANTPTQREAFDELDLVAREIIHDLEGDM